MYRIPRFRVQLVRESTHATATRTISAPVDAFEILREYLDSQDRETFVVLLLDTRNAVIGLHVASIGTLNASLVHPREVFKVAFLANAASLIAAHNHPSGDPKPSKADIDMTRMVKGALAAVGISVHDHLVIGASGHVSFKAMGLL